MFTFRSVCRVFAGRQRTHWAYNAISTGVAVCCLGMPIDLGAQVGGGVTKGATCAASNAANSTQILPARGSRAGYVVINDSNVSIRVALGLGTGVTTVLDDTNSVILLPSGTLNDGMPGVFYGSVNCQSTTTSGVAIHYAE